MCDKLMDRSVKTIYTINYIEQARLTPFSPYGAHKLMMEILCQSYATNFDLQIVIPRLFSVYGTELRKQLLWDTLLQFQPLDESQRQKKISDARNAATERMTRFGEDFTRLAESCAKKV